jgi:hypothetical protein
MRYLTALTMLMSLGAIPCTAKANNSCPIAMEKRADASLVSAAGAWGPLSRHRKTFVSCDDGAIAEGYSEAVVSLLAYQWDQFEVFAALSERNPTFRRWAIRHIDPTASTDDLKKVVRNAERCTGAKAKDLCREVGRAARDALND